MASQFIHIITWCVEKYHDYHIIVQTSCIKPFSDAICCNNHLVYNLVLAVLLIIIIPKCRQNSS